MSDTQDQQKVEIAGTFAAKKEHQLTDSVLQQAIESFEAAAIRFAQDAIKDASVRQSYISNIQRISKQVRADVAARHCTVKQGAEFCVEMRNKILDEHRKYSSAVGRAIAQKKKRVGESLEELIEKYSKRRFNKKFSSLIAKQKQAVYYEIIESAGRDNVKFSSGTRKLRVIGKVGILITAALATYQILNSDNKVKETARQGMIIGGGAIGGLLAGLGVSAICGPGAPICAVAVVLLGSIGGGFLSERIADSFDEELEEFSKWVIR